MKFVDLFAGMGGFHRALSSLGHECVFASELDDELRSLYKRNYRSARKVTHGDIREVAQLVPAHDILCAGFPCQPFSKSGAQRGRRDRTRGTLFHDILEILERRRPQFVFLENVGNFERHNGGRTWKVVEASLVQLGYNVRGTTHIASGGHGLISPHHFGWPHHRERFFIVASLNALPEDPFPRGDRRATSSLLEILQPNRELTAEERAEAALTPQQVECIEHWNVLLKRVPDSIPLPSFPIWGDENGAKYPYEKATPSARPLREWRQDLGVNGRAHGLSKREALALLPSYARDPRSRFPEWKIDFIRQNREWFRDVSGHVPRDWSKRLQEFPPSLRKLEWNCQGELRDLWRHVLQFRPSGLRVKRISSSPALVAMTTTQVPIVGPKRRFITRIEALRLQGFPDSHLLPAGRPAAFTALGNAVHVGVVRRIAKQLLA